MNTCYFFNHKWSKWSEPKREILESRSFLTAYFIEHEYGFVQTRKCLNCNIIKSRKAKE